MTVSSTWALCPPQAGQRSSHHPLVCLPPASVLPASFPVAIVACHVSAGSRCSALFFNKSSYVLEGRWRVQTTITTGTLHQSVIWLSQAHWQTALWHGAEAECCVSDREEAWHWRQERDSFLQTKKLKKFKCWEERTKQWNKPEKVRTCQRKFKWLKLQGYMIFNFSRCRFHLSHVHRSSYFTAFLCCLYPYEY